jgi:hypothetical protein
MPTKKPGNHRQPWTTAEVRQLKREIKENTPTRLMAVKHGRTASAIHQKAWELGLSITRTTSQSPSARRAKRK